jgi:HNH endonuclease/NUMOD4 motif
MSARETWRPVCGHPGYEVSDLGRVRSLDRVIHFPDGRSRRAPGVPLSPVADKLGYRFVTLAGRRRPVHQLVLEAFVGSRPDGYESLHGNDVPSDNRLTNLRWGTRADNVQDAVERRRHVHSKRTHCPRRHPLEAPNLVSWHERNGKRSCRSCHRARADAQHARRRGLPQVDIQAAADAHFRTIMEGSHV